MAHSFNDAMAYPNTKSLLLELIGDKETITVQKTQMDDCRQKYDTLRKFCNHILDDSYLSPLIDMKFGNDVYCVNRKNKLL